MAKSSGPLGFLDSPTGWILAGGVVYLAYLILTEFFKTKEDLEKGLKDVAEGFNPNPSHVPSDQPLGPPPGGSHFTAKIMEPANGGIAERGFFDRKFKVSVQLGNPGDYAVVEVVVRVTMISRLTGNEEVAQVARQIQLSKGTSVHDFWIHLFGLVTHDGIAEVLLNGKSLASPVSFTID